jgi:hypothetical protein
VKRCCAICFGDRGLKRNIIPLVTDTVGQCSYCRTPNEQLVLPERLRDYFAPVVGVYETSAEGDRLAKLLRADWSLFDHRLMNDARAGELIGAILGDDQIALGRFVPLPRYATDTLARWEALRNELMYESRYFPESELDATRWEDLLQHLEAAGAAEFPSTWFRARMKTGERVFEISEMGAPPNRIASHGRANPPGIACLYLGSQPETAVAEIRPHTGESACVADFTIPTDTVLIDLRDPRRLVSPFLLGDEGAIGSLRSDVAFLERLGDELTRPVQPHGAPIDYVPSQYLCEFIKKRRYRGVLYRSSVSDGMNLALFDPSRAQGGNVTEYAVTRVSVNVEVRP